MVGHYSVVLMATMIPMKYNLVIRWQIVKKKQRERKVHRTRKKEREMNKSLPIVGILGVTHICEVDT